MQKQQIDSVRPSFVRISADETDGWCPPEPTGHYQTDFETGLCLADQAVRYARKSFDPAFIAFVASSIAAKAGDGSCKLGGIEAGFLDQICKLAYVGSAN